MDLICGPGIRKVEDVMADEQSKKNSPRSRKRPAPG